MGATRPTRGRLALRIAGRALVILVLTEALLHLLGVLAGPIDAAVSADYEWRHPRVVADPELGWRPSPEFPGHDALGYRNAEPLARADLVSLGDSNTYGYFVAPNDVWPQRLGSATDASVYNFAFGGFGPTHSLVLLDRALALEPRLVIEAVYPANDFVESYQHVYHYGAFPEFQTTDAAVLDAVRERDAERSFSRYDPRQPRLLARVSRLFGIARRLRNAWRASPWAWPQLAPGQIAFEHESTRTVFWPKWRTIGLDDQDPRVDEGLRIAVEAVKRTHERTTAAGSRFLVVLIPTKERVYRPLVERVRPEPVPALVRHWHLESIRWAELCSALDDAGIEYVDSTPALQAALGRGTNPYRDDHDGHPNAAGHRELASLLERVLSR